MESHQGRPGTAVNIHDTVVYIDIIIKVYFYKNSAMLKMPSLITKQNSYSSSNEQIGYFFQLLTIAKFITYKLTVVPF